MRACITEHRGGSAWADDVQDHRMEDRLGLLNATIELNRKSSRQERAEKEQEEIRQEASNRLHTVNERQLRAERLLRVERLLRATIKLKQKHSSKGKKEPKEQKKDKRIIQDRSLDERLLQAATKLKVRRHIQEMGDKTTRDDNHSPLDDRLLNPAIKLKANAKHSSKPDLIVNPKQKQKNRLLHPNIKVREHIIIISGSSDSLHSQHTHQHVYYENNYAGFHTDVAHTSSPDSSLGKPCRKREILLRKLKGDDSNSFAVGSDENIHYSADTSVQNSMVASTQTDFDLPAAQTKSPMAGLFGMFWSCSTTMDAQLDSDKNHQDKYSGVQVKEDMLDYVFNDIEGFACRKEEEDLRDTRILPMPALKYEKDALDKVCEPMESMVCRAGSNAPGVNSATNTPEWTHYNQGTPKGQMRKNIQKDEGLLDYAFNNVESLEYHQSEYATHEVDQNYEKDIIDKVFEPLESMVCRDDVPEARRRAISDQKERIGDRLHESARRSAVFREARTSGIQSTRDAPGTGPIPLVVQYDERDALDNVFESMEGLVCRDPSAKDKHQRQKSAFGPAGSVGCRDDSPAVRGDWESNRRDEPTEQPRNIGSRASRQDTLDFRGHRYWIDKNDNYYTHDHKNAVDLLERDINSAKRNVLKKDRPKREPTPKWQSRHHINWRDE
jgi:hypothetical protein